MASTIYLSCWPMTLFITSIYTDKMEIDGSSLKSLSECDLKNQVKISWGLPSGYHMVYLSPADRFTDSFELFQQLKIRLAKHRFSNWTLGGSTCSATEVIPYNNVIYDKHLQRTDIGAVKEWQPLPFKQLCSNFLNVISSHQHNADHIYQPRNSSVIKLIFCNLFP